MTVKLHVRRGIEFKPQLKKDDKKAWYQEIGQQMQDKNLMVNVGKFGEYFDGAQIADLFELYHRNPQEVADRFDMQKDKELSEYMRDLTETLDDLVKDSTIVEQKVSVSGQPPIEVIDLGPKSALGKMLGLDSDTVRYASLKTQFSEKVKEKNTFSIMGIRLSNESFVGRPDPLAGQTFISAATFRNAQSSGWGNRNGVEYEVVRRLTGLSGKDIYKLAMTELEPVTATDPAKTALRKMRKPKYAEALTLGTVEIDEMDWSAKAHATREKVPFIDLTIEPSRLSIEDGERKVTVGTDYFADTYYKAKDFKTPKGDLLLDNGMILRGRIRMDTPGNPTRILVQVKIEEEGQGVDGSGMKSVHKIDTRSGGSASTVEGLDLAIRSGQNINSLDASEPIKVLYADMAKRGLLPDVGDAEGVLQLEAGAHVFSERGRIHFDEANHSTTRKLYNSGEAWMREVGTWIETSESLPKVKKEEMLAKLESILDYSLLLEKTKGELLALDPEMAVNGEITVSDIKSLLPDSGGMSNAFDYKKGEIVAAAIKNIYDDFADDFDDMRRQISGVRDINGDRDPAVRQMNFVEEFTSFAKANKNVDELKTTPKSFLEHLDVVLDPNTTIIRAFDSSTNTYISLSPEQYVERFAEYLSSEHNENDLKDAFSQNPKEALAMMANLRKNVLAEHLNVLDRQVKEAGSAAQTVWMNAAKMDLGDINQSSGNFIIDTFDFVKAISLKDWETLTDDQRTGVEEIPTEKIVNADIISEVQVELGSENKYTDALKNVKTQVLEQQAFLFENFILDQQNNLKPSTFSERVVKEFAEKVQGMTDAEKEAMIDEIGEYAKKKGIMLGIDNITDLDAVLSGQISGEISIVLAPLDISKNREIFYKNELIGKSFKVLRDAQNQISMFREERIQKYADEVGFTGVTWEPSEMSKGEKALKVENGTHSVS